MSAKATHAMIDRLVQILHNELEEHRVLLGRVAYGDIPVLCKLNGYTSPQRLDGRDCTCPRCTYVREVREILKRKTL